LIPIAIIGVGFFIMQCVLALQRHDARDVLFEACHKGDTAEKSPIYLGCLKKIPIIPWNLAQLDNEYNFYFMLIVAVWCTIFVENWKRK
jgi:hypothetical protein